MVQIQNSQNILKVQVKNKQNIVSSTINTDSAPYYSDLAKSWAIKINNKVDGIDYSSKYYALMSLESSNKAISAKDSILNNSDFQSVAEDLSHGNNIKTCSDNILDIQNAKTNAQIASNSAQIATEKALLITETLENSANKSLSNITEEGINFLKNNVCFWEKIQGSLNEQSDLVEEFQNKLSTDHSNDTAPYITETYQNGNSWYRIWSDGWCEQGGIVSLTNNQTLTVNLLKSYTNSTYSILQSPLTTNYTDVWGYGTKIVSLTNSSFNIYINSSTSGKVCWQASGYKQ